MATKPMDAYSRLLCQPEWQRKRMQIMERDGFRCVQCRETSEPGNPLQVDHKKYAPGGLPWDVPDTYLQTVCKRCHERFTALRQRVRELIAEMNLYELPLAIELLEGFWGSAGPPLSAVARPGRTDAALRRLELIRSYEREKANLMELEFSPARSRRVEDLDELIDSAWKQIQEAA